VFRCLIAVASVEYFLEYPNVDSDARDTWGYLILGYSTFGIFVVIVLNLVVASAQFKQLGALNVPRIILFNIFLSFLPRTSLILSNVQLSVIQPVCFLADVVTAVALMTIYLVTVENLRRATVTFLARPVDLGVSSVLSYGRFVLRPCIDAWYLASPLPRGELDCSCGFMGTVPFVLVAELLWIKYGAGWFGETIRYKQVKDKRKREAETDAYHLGISLLEDDGLAASLQVMVSELSWHQLEHSLAGVDCNQPTGAAKTAPGVHPCVRHPRSRPDREGQLWHCVPGHVQQRHSGGEGVVVVGRQPRRGDFRDQDVEKHP
jgi:hypothetical protein